MVSLEKVIAAAIREPGVIEQLGEALSDELVVASPFYRQLVEWVRAFNRKHRRLPKAGDYGLWLSLLPEGQRQGLQDALGRLDSQDISGYTPAYLAEHVIGELRIVATQNAILKLRTTPDASADLLARLAESVAGISTNGNKAPADQFPTLGDLVRDQDLMREPDELIPRLVWRGCLTILTGLPFLGKSTIGAQGVAAASQGGAFLDGKAVRGKVLWVNVADEPLGRTVQRLVACEADKERVRVYDFREPSADLLTSLKRATDEFQPDALVIDSLIAWARATAKEIPSGGDAAAWTHVTRPLSELAHERNTGVVVYHHARRDDGRYRDSGEIAAAADVMIEMLPPRGGQNPNLRRFEAVSRLSGRTAWNAAYRDGLYRFGGEVSETEGDTNEAAERMAPEVLAYIKENDGCSKNAIKTGIPGDYPAKMAALDLLEKQGKVSVDAPPGKGKPSKVWIVAEAVADPGGEEG